MLTCSRNVERVSGKPINRRTCTVLLLNASLDCFALQDVGRITDDLVAKTAAYFGMYDWLYTLV